MASGDIWYCSWAALAKDADATMLPIKPAVLPETTSSITTRPRSNHLCDAPISIFSSAKPTSLSSTMSLAALRHKSSIAYVTVKADRQFKDDAPREILSGETGSDILLLSKERNKYIM
jgi:hypothetical protein